MALAAIFAMIIGLLLGLLGGGGSILTVPVLVYLLNFEAKDAIVTSLIIVMLTSAIAMISHARKANVCWITGLVFSITGVIGAYAGGRLSVFVPDQLLLLLFAIVMLVSSFYMLRSSPLAMHIPFGTNPCPKNLPLAAIFFDGFVVGSITGLLGVGGGFLLVPALSFLLRLPIHAAIGTSLLIITLQSIAALAGHAGHINIDTYLVTVFTAFAVAGSLAGSFLSQKISPKKLKQAFGVFVLIIACFMLYQDLDQQTIETIRMVYQAHKEFVLGAMTMIVIYIAYRLRLWIHAKNL